MDLLYALALVATAAPVIGPTGVELERLIDTTVQLPGTTGTFFFEGPPPLPCGRGIVFRAVESTMSMSWGYYLGPGGVEVFVNGNTAVPGTPHKFQDLDDIRCSGGDHYVFLGSSALSSSVYEWLPGGQINLIQGGGMSIGGHEFGSFFDLGSNQHGVGILGNLDPQSDGEALAVKFFGREPIFVADETEILPGQTVPVTGYGSPRLVGSDLVFRALSFLTRGLYRWSEGQGISLLIDDQTPVPGAEGTFVGVGTITTLSDGIAFTAGYSGGIGIFLLRHGGQIEPLVLPGQQTEGGQTITSASIPIGAGNLFTFRGFTKEPEFAASVFARTPDGKIYRILGVTDVIEGQIVRTIDAAADHDTVVVRILTNKLQGILYRANFNTAIDIPVLSPRAVVALAFSILMAGLWSLWRKAGAIRRDGRGRQRPPAAKTRPAQ